MEKAESATFDKLSYHNERLGEVVQEVNEAIEKRHPEWPEIRFVLNNAKHLPATPIRPGATVDPKTGIVQNPPDAKPEKLDLSAVRINGELEQKGASLWDVLQLIVNSADHPITYSFPGDVIELSFADHENYANSKRRELHKALGEYVNFSCTNATLEEVVRDLPKTARYYGEIEGFNFMLDTRRASDLAKVEIRGIPDTNGVRLENLLDIITSHADQPVTFRLLDTGVEFSFIDPDLKPEMADLNGDTEFARKGPKIRMDVKFVELDPITSRARGTNWYFNILDSNRYGEFIGVPNDEQLKEILRNTGPEKTVKLLNEARLTTIGGHNVEIRMKDRATNGEYMALNEEVQIDTSPETSKRGDAIQMKLFVNWTVSLPFDSPYWIRRKHTAGEVPATTLSDVLPPSRGSASITNCILQNGQSIVMGRSADILNFTTADGGRTNVSYSAAKNRSQFLLITPAIISR